MSVINQKEYLKKYLSLGDEKDKSKKRKKKSKIIKDRLKIIDDDIDVPHNINENELNEFLTAEDAPQVCGIVDERPLSMRIDDYRKSDKWKLVGSDDELKDSQKNKKLNYDSDLSPSRNKNSDSDASPPRKTKQKSRFTDSSPPRRSRKKSDSDASPPRKTRKTIDSDVSPPRRTRKKSDDSDVSPPRKTIDSDVSPPRKTRKSESNVSPPRRSRKTTDSDASPPRRTKHNSDSDHSPPRRNPDTKTKRKSRFTDASPPRRAKKNSESDNSPPRKPNRHSEKNSASSKPPKKLTKTLDGKAAGLQTGKDLKIESVALRKREDDLFKNMSAEISGKDAAPILRDRKTGKKRDLEKEAIEEFEKQQIENAKKEKYDKWGKGLKQVEDRREQIQEEIHEMSKPLARYADDEDLEKYLKDQEREGDPMLQYIRKKKKDKAIASGDPKSLKPQYDGEFMPNRFGIPPGHRWDGVDRSNGYEKEWFKVQNSKKAVEEEIYKWSTEDM